MSDRHAFGASLRRVRLKKGIPLEKLAAATNVPVPMWEALEDGELYAWPNGVLARSLVREYARIVGLDQPETLNEFCRLFPNGDRRRTRLIAELASCIDQPVEALDDVPPEADRRASSRSRPPVRRPLAVRGPAVESAGLALAVAGGARLASTVVRVPFGVALVVAAAACYPLSGVLRRAIGRWTASRRARRDTLTTWWRRFGKGISAHL